ncbi:hypothetical protein Rhal01_01298 [Rubritalea halochordaticola]|uniref:HEAT repeat domain-containing protein n=1 Tax=Rubritalea halochordaticola TaxID=714537 RepID=A0ABP9V204_9BACT
MSDSTIYESPSPISRGEVQAAIESNNLEQLKMVPISLGFYHTDWRYIQEISCQLSTHPDHQVRANSLLGLEYAARFQGGLDKDTAAAVLHRSLHDPSTSVAQRAEDVIEALNHLMDWSI